MRFSHQVIRRILAVVIVLGSGVFAAEVLYYFWPRTPPQGVQAPPPEAQAASQGEFLWIGERIPDQLLPVETDVLVLIPVPCSQCDENVPTWNELFVAGVNLVGVAQGIETDTALFRERTKAIFPIQMNNEKRFWEQFGDKENAAVTLVMNADRLVTWAKIGRVWDPERIKKQVDAANAPGGD